MAGYQGEIDYNKLPQSQQFLIIPQRPSTFKSYRFCIAFGALFFGCIVCGVIMRAIGNLRECDCDKLTGKWNYYHPDSPIIKCYDNNYTIYENYCKNTVYHPKELNGEVACIGEIMNPFTEHFNYECIDENYAYYFEVTPRSSMEYFSIVLIIIGIFGILVSLCAAMCKKMNKKKSVEKRKKPLIQ